MGELAQIKPFVYKDRLMGYTIEVRVSPYFSTIRIGDRIYYFVRDTGEFDGTSAPMGEKRSCSKDATAESDRA